MVDEKPLRFVGRAYAELVGFPALARQRAGATLQRVQRGDEPESWKPFGAVGPGVAELRIRVDKGGSVQYRVIYVARFPEAVYVLHAFQKKSEATPRRNIDVARARHAQLLKERARDSSPPTKG